MHHVALAAGRQYGCDQRGAVVALDPPEPATLFPVGTHGNDLLVNEPRPQPRYSNWPGVASGMAAPRRRSHDRRLTRWHQPSDQHVAHRVERDGGTAGQPTRSRPGDYAGRAYESGADGLMYSALRSTVR